MKSGIFISNIRLVSFVATLLLLATTSYSPALAQSSPSQSPKVRLEHSPPMAKDLPAPGSPLTLKVRLKGTRNLDQTLRAFISSDGRVSDHTIPSAKFNQSEEIEYELTFPAPIAGVSYQFALHLADGSQSITTNRYEILRDCIPNIDLAPENLPEKLKSDERLLLMVKQSRDLERDDQNYQRVLTLLKEIREMIEVKE